MPHSKKIQAEEACDMDMDGLDQEVPTWDHRDPITYHYSQQKDSAQSLTIAFDSQCYPSLEPAVLLN